MKRTTLLKTMFLLCALVAGSSSVWAVDRVTIASFNMSTELGTNSTSWKCNADKQSSTYYKMYNGKTIESPTINFSGYSNVKVVVKARKLGGPSDTQKVISIYQGTTTNVLGTHDGPTGTSLVNLSAISIAPSDGSIVIACLGAGTDKGCGISEVTITGEEISTDADSEVSFANAEVSFDLKDAASYTQTATTATGYDETDGASVTYSITANTADASINEETGEVTPKKAGSVTVKASAAKVEGSWAASSTTYTLLVSDTRESAGLAWSESSVEIEKDATSYTLPTLSNPNNLAITYNITGTENLASETSGVITIDTSIEGTATISASFAGNRTYKSANVSYVVTVYDPTKKGTKRNPYSVAEIIEMDPTSTSTATEEGVYVIGYIVGTVNSSTGELVSTNISSDTNIAIADSPTEETDYASVQLPSGTIRTALNAKPANHPYYVGCAKVLVKGDIYLYCKRPGVKNPTEGSVVGQKIKITSAGLATYCTDVNLKFDGDVEAYIAKEENAAITLLKVTNVPANTGVLLRAAGISSDTSFDIDVTTDADDVEDNIFVKGNDAAVASGSGPYNYILNKVNDVVGFYHANGKKVAKNRAYLQTTINATSEAPILIDFEGGTTAIKNIESETINGEVYNLNGQRVAQPTKGLYIVNGKKVIVK